MKNRSGEKIKLASIDELLGVVNEESAMEIEISKIHPFKNHPFKVLDDEKMQDLVESVKINGVLTPVLLRMDENEEYEMVSGHRRMHAAQLAGLTTIPAIVRELSDDDAIVAMVDANIQREELLPSEKAFAYKMKLEAMKRQGVRTDLTCVQNEHKLGKKSRELLGEQVGISSVQVTRYIRLTELIPELLDLVDNKKLRPYKFATSGNRSALTLAGLVPSAGLSARPAHAAGALLRRGRSDSITSAKPEEDAVGNQCRIRQKGGIVSWRYFTLQ